MGWEFQNGLPKLFLEFLRRFQSRNWPGLQSSEGLTVAEGSAFKLTCIGAGGRQQSLSDCWEEASVACDPCGPLQRTA